MACATRSIRAWPSGCEAFFPPRLRGGWPSASEAGWGFANAVRLRRGQDPSPTLPEDGEGEGTFYPPGHRGGWPSASEAGWGFTNAVRCAAEKTPPRPSPRTGREKER